MTEQITGNQNVSSDFIRVLLALKANTMRSIPVAELCVVTETSNDLIRATLLTNSHLSIDATLMSGLTVQKDDIVLVVFTKSRFIEQLSKLKAGKPADITAESSDIHSLQNGVIVGLVYRRSA